MKPFTLLQFIQLINLLVTAYGLNAQTIYVKSDALGANDGTSWENAFIDFSDALDSASDGDMLWVAAGVYHPGSSAPDVNSVFAVRQNISIYGGFAGTEVNFEERDPSVNLTVLSGDINEDDIEGDFTTNKSENTRHVMYVDSLLNLVIIDGLTIKGGQTTNNNNLQLYLKAGGGIYGLSPVDINNCKFNGNFARTGGGIYLTKSASNSSIYESSFSHNKTTDGGSGIYFFKISDIVIANCSFTDNETYRGALYPNACRNVIVENCFFQDNFNTGFNGGALFSFQNYSMVIRHCQFNRNSTAFSGGAIVVNGGQIPTDSVANVKIDNCSFIDNKAEENGGAILLFTCPDIMISKCEFKRDSAGSGGGIYINQPGNYITDTNDIRIDSCLFENNKADSMGGGGLYLNFTSAKVEHCLFDSNSTKGLNNGGGGHIFQNCPGKQVVYRDVEFRNGQSLGYGGASTAFGKDANFLFEFCQFNNNSSERAGGAVDNAGGAVFIYKNCTFSDNVSMARGGAVSLSRDSTEVHFEHSNFTGNESLQNGGAISSAFGSQIIVMENCVLDSNRTVIGFGGAISIIESGDDNIATLTINNSLFRFNSSVSQGGALNILDADTYITNSVFTENVCSDLGFGAAMSIKATTQDTIMAKLINTTIADNHGSQADGMGLGEEDEAAITTTIQNCIFRNQGSTNYNYIFGTGLPELISDGGNMSDDESMIDILMNLNDLNQTSPLFKLDYSLMSNSPGIDAGVAGAPEFDILGNPRVNEPDMGAYENQMPVSVKENRYNDQHTLTVYPNPSRDQNPTARLMNAWRGDIKVQLSDPEGRIVYSAKIQKPDELYLLTLPMQNLNTGSYQLLVSNGQKSISGNIVKMQ
jgi:hypothetical protein